MNLSSWFSYFVLKFRLCYLTMQAHFCSANELLDHSPCSAGAPASSPTIFLSHIAPALASSQITVFFSHSTLAPACRTQWLLPINIFIGQSLFFLSGRLCSSKENVHKLPIVFGRSFVSVGIHMGSTGWCWFRNLRPRPHFYFISNNAQLMIFFSILQAEVPQTPSDNNASMHFPACNKLPCMHYDMMIIALWRWSSCPS